VGFINVFFSEGTPVMNKRAKKKLANPKKAKSMVSNKNLETEIVIETESDIEAPYCVLPPYFFERANALAAQRDRPLLSITSWDGRSVMEMARK